MTDQAPPRDVRLASVLMLLARNPGFPEGSDARGYELRVPLGADAHLDAEAFRARREDCTVRRFWQDQPDQHGHLVHGRHGWRFDYGPGTDDDEPIHRLDAHAIRPGEYVSVREADGETLTFRIVSVR
jgi:hypothetical protein